MKVIHVNYSDFDGGAGRAAFRIHQALLARGIRSEMHVNKNTVEDRSVVGPSNNFEKFFDTIARPQFSGFFSRIQKSENFGPLSPAFFPSRKVKLLNESDADLIHLHWIGFESLSISDVARLKKPLIWTLHDMWGFCGAEHVTEHRRWVEGYNSNNRPVGEGGFDLNKWVWRRKLRNWTHPIPIVTPSNWLAGCVRESRLMSGWPVTVIPNCIDLEIWRPIDRLIARDILGLPSEKSLLLFGTSGQNGSRHKGFDLLVGALRQIGSRIDGLELVVFGGALSCDGLDLKIPVHNLGKVSDETTLRLIYSSVNAVVIPSRIDNLPNVGVEALACGTPVIGFDTCGLSDLIRHEITGYLARPFDSTDLARGIRWVLTPLGQHVTRANTRSYAISRFSAGSVAASYQQIYDSTINLSRDE
jgi:glycosyltransferase involved in cell wall biosynthesis